jgi:hypothetical protein
MNKQKFSDLERIEALDAHPHVMTGSVVGTLDSAVV